VTGFGLARHALNLTTPFGASININNTPIINGAIKYLNNGIYSSLSKSNKEAINFRGRIQNENNIIFDPQTSGGLLAAVDSKKSNKIIGELKENNCYAYVIGEVIDKAEIVLN
jgi:selenide,water dikinase